MFLKWEQHSSAETLFRQSTELTVNVFLIIQSQYGAPFTSTVLGHSKDKSTSHSVIPVCLDEIFLKE